jgi:hypothetical protein
VVAERAFVAQRLGRVNVAFDDEVGIGQNGFQFGENLSSLAQLGEENFRSTAKSFQSKQTAPSSTAALSFLPKELAWVVSKLGHYPGLTLVGEGQKIALNAFLRRSRRLIHAEWMWWSGSSADRAGRPCFS